MTRESRSLVLPLLLFVGASITTQAILAAAVEERDSQPAPLDCVINPSVVADLGSGVPGILSEVRVDRSDFVDAGEVVARLDSGVEVAARDLAKVRAEKDTEIKLRRVNAAFGRRQHKRTEDLFQRKVVSTNDMDERKTEAELAGIQLRQAIDNKEIATLELSRAEEVLKRRTIKSPISGVVMERFKTIGEYVDEQPVLRVAQLDPLHVEVFVPVERLGDIRPGMRAEVWSDAVRGMAWNAKVTRVDRVADVASGTYGVRLELPNPDYAVPAGLRCQLAFQPEPVLPMAERSGDPDVGETIAADVLGEDVVAVRAQKKPAPGEPPSDVSDGDAVAGQVEDGAPNDPSEQRAEEPAVADSRDPAAAPVAAPRPLAKPHKAPAESTDGPTPGTVTARPPAAGKAEALVGGVAGASRVDAAAGRIEVNTRDALTGRIDLELPPEMADEAAPVCISAGPFDNRAVATAQARRLRDAGLSASVEDRKISVGVGYRVVSAAFDSLSDATAVIERLKQAGVRDFYLAGSKAPFHVMLGSYSSAASADRRIKRMAGLGVGADKRPWTRNVDAYTVLVFGTPTADAQALLTQLPVRSDDKAPAHCEQLAAR